MQHFDDFTLVDLAIDGSQAAYRMLYDNYVNDLFRFVGQFSKSRTETADLVQQSFIKCFTKLHTFAKKSSFKTWLFGIAVREMQQDWRANQKMLTEFIENEEAVLLETENALQHCEHNELLTLIAQLDPQKKLVFMLFEVEGYSHKEIAEMLELKESHCRTLLTRAKVELRTRIEKA